MNIRAIQAEREVFQYRELLKNLILKDLKVKYRGSFLGFLWSLLNPLAMILIYSVAFKYILRIQLENFTLFLIVGILPWNFFSAATMAATEAIISNANLIKKIHFPRVILPIATVLFHFVQLLLALLVFFPALLVFQAPLTPAIALYPIVLALQLLFTVGLAQFLATITVFYRDVKYLTEVGLMMLFWMTPIIYHFSMIPESMQSLFRLNPLTVYITSYQDIFYWGRTPTMEMLGMGTFWAVLSLSIGSWVFYRRKNLFAEEL